METITCAREMGRCNPRMQCTGLRFNLDSNEIQQAGDAAPKESTHLKRSELCQCFGTRDRKPIRHIAGYAIVFWRFALQSAEKVSDEMNQDRFC